MCGGNKNRNEKTKEISAKNQFLNWKIGLTNGKYFIEK